MSSTNSHRPFTLNRKSDQVFLRWEGDEQETAVRVLLARPFTGNGEIAILEASKRKELVLLSTLDGVNLETAAIIRDELERRYFLPRVTRILRTDAHFGNRFWTVETDRGPRRFMMKSPQTDVTWLTPDRLILRDAQGNCYELPSLQGLDPESRKWADRVL